MKSIINEINILEDIEKRFEDELTKSINELKGDLNLELNYRKMNLQSLKKLKIYKETTKIKQQAYKLC